VTWWRDAGGEEGEVVHWGCGQGEGWQGWQDAEEDQL